MYVAILTIVDPELNAKLRPAHLEYINQLYLQDKVVMAGPFADQRGGMVIFRTDSPEEAKQMAEADPVVRGGARTLELREWKPLSFPLA